VTAEDQPRFQQVRDDYAALEPGQSDTWNPLVRDVELEHRVELLRCLAYALRASGRPHDELAVVDVGCGNGRSTRVYLDLGLTPGQLTGVDLRAGALALAATLNPAITWREVDHAPWPMEAGSVSWVSLCTVFSSIASAADRRHLAAEITRIASPTGQLFFWDRTHALDFAGGQPLVPTEWFDGFAVIWQADAVVSGYGGDTPTHRAWLLQRP